MPKQKSTHSQKPENIEGKRQKEKFKEANLTDIPDIAQWVAVYNGYIGMFTGFYGTCFLIGFHYLGRGDGGSAYSLHRG